MMLLNNLYRSFRPQRVAAGSPEFLVIMAQGRSGSTLLLRMLNVVPGVRISGENKKALDHLRCFLDCFQYANQWNQEDDFCRQAWKLPCSLPVLQQCTRQFILDLYDPNRSHQLVGFKEIRYGREDYDALQQDISFMRMLFPTLKIIFNTRQTDTAVKSSFWEDTPNARSILDTSHTNFHRFHQENPQFTYIIPFEDLHPNSRPLQGMFEFLNLPFTSAAAAQLNIKLR